MHSFQNNNNTTIDLVIVKQFYSKNFHLKLMNLLDIALTNVSKIKMFKSQEFTFFQNNKQVITTTVKREEKKTT